MVKKQTNVIGAWAFLIGVVLAILIAFLGGAINSTILWIFLVVGLVVGLMNVSEEETQSFMMSGIVLIIAVSLGQEAFSISPLLIRILDGFLLIFVPAVIIVAIKNVFGIAKH
jgi:hypothetical protein